MAEDMIDGLIERLEKANSDGDRALDLDIARALVPDVIVLKRDRDTGENHEFTYWHYTSAVDAALSLVQRTLPAWFPSIGQNIHYGHWRGMVRIVEETNGDITSFEGEHRTSPSIALCIAALKAQRAQGVPSSQEQVREKD